MKFNRELYVELDVLKKQKYIKIIKDKFERLLAKNLELTRVSAPLFVTKESGLQDDLNGFERKVEFDILKDGKTLEVVQSLAKWKRLALKKYCLPTYRGIYADMTAIRRDDSLDEIHSVYVDQWDWEKVILEKDRNLNYLKTTVKKIVKTLFETNEFLKKKGFLGVHICKEVYFITAEELLQKYPNSSSKEREYLITKEFKTVFIMGIGAPLSDGQPHDGRAPDYDDWSLNGDLLVYHAVLDCALEISSMGVRVDKNSLLKQLESSNDLDRKELFYHQAVLNGELPLSIGGGIGQSRLCMLLLGRAHVGEVQSSYWDKETLLSCEKLKIELL